MHRGIKVGLIMAMGVMALVLGCGSDESDSLTKAEYVKQANTICEKRLKERRSALEAAIAKSAEVSEKKSPREAQEELATDVVLPPLRAMDEELEELGPPSGDEEQVDAIVSGLDSGLAEMEADPLRMIDEYGKVFRESSRLAEEYGLKSCALV